MKKIFVTVTEFLEKGGKLFKEREIFNNNGNKMGDYQKTVDINKIHVSNRVLSFDMLKDQSYVEIEVTPIYK